MGIFDKIRKKEKENLVSKKNKDSVLVEKTEAENSEKRGTAETTEKKKEVYSESRAKQIVMRPLITEKATMLGDHNKYLFEVHSGTNKVEIKKEMKRLYSVDPLSVNIINHGGKAVRYGRRSGSTKKWKKAIITLKEGDRIETKVGT